MSFDTNYSPAYRPTLSLQRPPSPSLSPFALQAPPPSCSQRASPPCLNLATVTTTPTHPEAPQVALFVQPASPALSSPGSFASAPEPSPPPETSTSFLPPAPSGLGGGLAARRQLNKKRLSLVVPNAPAASSLLSPTTPSFLQPNGSSSDADETRSLPPSPISLQAFIGAEGTEEEDRTIGRLMMKQQADEMREQMKGGRGMKRRTSIPRLNLAAPPGKLGGAGKPAPLNLGSTNGGSAVQLLRRDNAERAGAESSPSNGAAVEEEVAEEFPYALGPREILPGIFLGSEQNARDPAVLKEWGIGYVLNVAKEVECPWVDEVIAEEDEQEEEEMATADPARSTQDSPSVSIAPSTISPPPSRARPKHRRTKTQAAVAAPEVVNAPPLFVRPTASTPNLQSIFNAASASPPPPAVPPLPQDLDALDAVAMARSLSSSPPQPRRSPPRSRKSLQIGVKATAPTTAADGAIRFPANARSGRPPLEYLWLKWGHDESDLVEALKFQSAFDFLDKARASSNGTGRVLVHCQCGVSRSATVVIAYCMREAAKALEEGREVPELASCTGMHDTYSFVKEKSEWVGPNLGLVFQLVAYERTLRGGPDALNEEEPPYPDYPSEQDLEPVDYSHPGYSHVTASSPRTPISSEGSSASDSHLSTPEVDPPMTMSPAFTSSGKTAASPLSILVGQPTLPSRVVIHDDDDEEILSPMAQDLQIHDHGDNFDKAPPTAQAGVFILPMPPARKSRPHDLSITPSFEEVSSPTTAIRPSFPSSQLDPTAPPAPVATRSSRASSVGAGANPFARLGLHLTPPRLTTDSPTTIPQQALSHGRPPLRSTTSSSAAEGPASLPSPVVAEEGGRASPRAVFGKQQTPSERRASHRRVFSDTMSLPAFLKGRSGSAASALSSASKE
ncbi:hypothetical protein BCR35DRAFT_335489 [Leucosporidium creatinivorum]|uniref:protein-tyrosine-phosphatase n=1 Tax=Leucosporidium creatinivorum TaxID=106004 RepID=A0A1Y2DA91_9BASI|nr:hypothetical protein BCR35DRAFT_335489 [Leucosporidium creatinivorum]